MAAQTGNPEAWFTWHSVVPAATSHGIDVRLTTPTGRLWDATTGGLVRTLESHIGWVQSVAWAPDSTRATTGRWQAPRSSLGSDAAVGERLGRRRPAEAIG